MAFNDYLLQDGKTKIIIGMITELNLIIVPISTGTHFYLFFIHKNWKNKCLLMQLYSLYSENRIEEISSLKEWFLSNDRVKPEELEL